MRNWRLRTKLLVVLLIPSIAALALGAFQVASDYAQAETLASNSQQIELDTSAARVVHELQRERDLTVAHIAAGPGAPRGALDEQRAVVDRAIARFRSDIRQAREGSHPEVAERFAAAASNLDRLAALRQVADTTRYPAEAALRAYTDSVENLLSLGDQGITRINNPELVRLYLASNALARAKEQESTKRALLAAALHSGGFGPGDQRELLAADAELDAALSDFRKWATPAQEQAYNDTVTGLMVDQAHTVEETALVRVQSGDSFSGLSPQEWLRYSTETVDLTNQVGTQMREQLQAKADALASDARTQMYIAAGLVLGALVLAFAIALMVARSLLLPLRTLRRSALDVADNRLPEAVESILDDSNPDVSARGRVEPIPVHTREEIGRVARSFDAVHSQALRLASEQALLRNNVNDLFVNLARRSQTLVQRQLSLIERLEQDEQDPDQLSSLFELDHLATRMRRNNENLLILGGTDLTRRMMRPVPLTEVAGAAVSEVEQYARVAIADAPDLAVQGRIVNDVVHLIAELLENATVFSNPDTEVTVRTAYRRQELVIEIRDRGVGIDAAELAEINDRLIRPPDVDVAVSRRMGLYVVGQLSRRHNIGVELQNNGDLEGGVTATVRLSGEFVFQLTPNGPMPMPDVQRAAADSQRDPLNDTGAHAGLAAAFGGGGADRELPEPPTERAMPVDGRSAPEPADEPEDDSWPATQDDSWSERADAGQSAELSTQYSVRVASGDSYGATDVPQWDASSGAEPQDHRGPVEQDDSFEAEWPSEDSVVDDETPEVHDGQCGVPPGVGDPGGLFHSPFEAEKTTQFARPVDDREPGREHTATTSDPVDHGVESRDQAEDTQSKGAAHDMDDAPTERLPIYEAVLSQWFRESDEDDYTRPVTSGSLSADADNAEAASWNELAGRSNNGSSASRTPGAGHDDPDGHVGRNGSPVPNGSQQEPSTGRNGTPLPDGPQQKPSIGRNGATPEVETAEGPRIGRRAATREQRERAADQRQAADPGWGAGDVGWQAAEALVEQSQQEQETTSAGLPKRRPKSNLVPGSAAAQPQSPEPSKPAAPRSADAVRGRMSNFQQGVRRGRHAKAEEPSSADQSRSIQSRHEEQE